MSTRSTISMIDPLNPTLIKTAYCHYDGYLDGVGRKLLESYDTQEKVEKLLSSNRDIRDLLGDEPDFFDDSINAWNPAFIKHDCLYGIDEQDYNYLFKEGVWYLMTDINSNGYCVFKNGLKPLKDLINTSSL